MSKDITLKPVLAALGTVFAVSLTLSPLAQAAENPFDTQGSGIVVADNQGNDKDAGKSEAAKKCDEKKNADEKKKCEDEAAKSKENKK